MGELVRGLWRWLGMVECTVGGRGFGSCLTPCRLGQ